MNKSSEDKDVRASWDAAEDGAARCARQVAHSSRTSGGEPHPQAACNTLTEFKKAKPRRCLRRRFGEHEGVFGKYKYPLMV